MSLVQAIHVVHLTSAHRATDNRFFGKESRSLLAAGYRVSIIAPHSHSEIIDGIKIIGIPKPSSRVARFTVTFWRLLFAALKEQAQIYHFHDPDLIPLGLILKLLGKKVIYDVHEDYYIQIRAKAWINPALRSIIAGFVRSMEFHSERFFDGIVAATPHIASRFKSAPTATVPNFPILSELTLDSPTPYLARSAKILYSGQITEHRGILQMIQAIEIANQTNQVNLSLVGTFKGHPQLESTARNLKGWKFVDFHGWVNRNEIGGLVDQCRIGLVVLHPIENYLDSYPAKLFEYMAAGIPVIASNFPLWRQIVDQADCGLLVDPLDVNQIAAAICQLLNNPEKAEKLGQNGRRAAYQNYNWGNSEKNLLEFYEKISVNSKKLLSTQL